MLILLLAGALGAVSGPAYAEDGPAAPPTPEKKICRSIVPTGSIMGKRFCLTKSEWKQFDALNQEDADAALSKKVPVSPREPG